MPWVIVIWVVVWLVRSWAASRNGQKASDGWDAWTMFTHRGRVTGQTGPDVRSFHGRAGRSEWAFQMVWNSTVAGLLAAAPMVGPVLALPWVYASLAVSGRRLHDLGRSAWLVLVPFAFAAAAVGAVALLNESSDALVQNLLDASDPMKLGLRIAVVLSAAGVGAFFLWLAAVGNDAGSNRYGEADRY